VGVIARFIPWLNGAAVRFEDLNLRNQRGSGHGFSVDIQADVLDLGICG